MNRHEIFYCWKSLHASFIVVEKNTVPKCQCYSILNRIPRTLQHLLLEVYRSKTIQCWQLLICTVLSCLPHYFSLFNIEVRLKRNITLPLQIYYMCTFIICASDNVVIIGWEIQEELIVDGILFIQVNQVFLEVISYLNLRCMRITCCSNIP